MGGASNKANSSCEGVGQQMGVLARGDVQCC